MEAKLLSFPVAQPFLKKQKEEFEADFSFGSSKVSKGKLVTNNLPGSKRIPCGWCLLLHFMGSYPLITSSELPSLACNLPVEWVHAVTITQKSYAGSTFTVSHILLNLDFPSPLLFLISRQKIGKLLGLQ